ncbi:hypothetical protein SAMN04488008_101601 [Maribacter orientalis]|uniref:Lumazine-binding n=1 Tax=Maribacter orientalis TaxID=228957 RepID=A0A1H7HJQ6_9FLAO|nr:3-methyl-2-oxobutanoate hydroxymethyltransferase [Maribacter orientalis]SEK50358.1 hypothetical protein SAMN04488008_101601 [Maribacter orientalis]
MKLPLFFIFGLMNLVALAQTEEEIQVKQNIIEFFDAFHAKDSIAMKKTVYPSILLQTIGVNNEGKSVLKTENFEDLVKSIISIPDSTNFEERILSYSIQIDGNMANAWTPYEFWINDKFHHCGVNSFQLFREENAWKIIYLIDTRRKSDCSVLP